MSSPEEISRLLQLDKASNEEALFAALYDELHGVARRFMGGQPQEHTLQPTALVHEAWIRVANAGSVSTDDHEKFRCVAARAMRSVLIDCARRKSTIKRDAGDRVPLDAVLCAFEDRATDLLTLNDALVELAGRSERAARVVELRFFGGLSIDETARAMGQSTATIERDWRTARAWLETKLT